MHEFQLHCILPVSEINASTSEPSYPDVLEMDSKIRDFDVPNALRMIDHDGVAPTHPKALQQAMVACTREIGMSSSAYPTARLLQIVLTRRHSSPAITPELLHSCHECHGWVQGVDIQIFTVGAGGIHEQLQPPLDCVHVVPMGTGIEHEILAVLE